VVSLSSTSEENYHKENQDAGLAWRNEGQLLNTARASKNSTWTFPDLLYFRANYKPVV
jgi:hypothetical protein